VQRGRPTWNKSDERDDTDQTALLQHYTVFNGIINKPPIYDPYKVTFVEQSNFDPLDTCDEKWFHKLNTKLITKA